MRNMIMFILAVIAITIETGLEKLGLISGMVANENLAKKYSGLTEKFQNNSRGGAISDELADKVGEALTKSGAAFTVNSVAKLITDNKWYDTTTAKNPESAMKTVARRILIKLGIIQKKN